MPQYKIVWVDYLKPYNEQSSIFEAYDQELAIFKFRKKFPYPQITNIIQS